MPELSFLVPGDPGQLTGGYIYDRHMVAGLRRHGWIVHVHGLPGRFPNPDQTASQAADACLSAIPDGQLVIMDGLALGGLPDVAARHGPRLRLIALVHHPLADETGLTALQSRQLAASERQALSQVRHVVVNSPFTAARMQDFGVDTGRLAIVAPGVEKAPLADPPPDSLTAGKPMRFLCVGSVVPRKGHDILLQALAGMTGLPGLANQHWGCDCAGSLARDAGHGRRVQALARELSLDSQICFHGECEQDALEKLWLGSHALVLASHYEGYGMVLTEALAHGLPIIATRGGAIAHTAPADAALLSPPGDIAELAKNLRRFMEQPDLRMALRDGAMAARQSQPTWHAASDHFAHIINGLDGPGIKHP